jgi:phosphopentomutase
MTVEQVFADNRKMERFICDRLRTDKSRIVMADGGDGPAWGNSSRSRECIRCALQPNCAMVANAMAHRPPEFAGIR